jgi:hypothetical protein
LRYYIPDWNDTVDRDYNFGADTHSSGKSDWSSEVYAHQMYSSPNYDGLLLSRVIAENTKTKSARIRSLGVHGYFRVPSFFPIIGDCGAFGYIDQPVPPYTTPDIVAYYTDLKFTYGVSIDHVITARCADPVARYELTVANARDFIREHASARPPWTPVAAIQGYDVDSYARAARDCRDMGYTYVAVGGIARATTARILRVARAVCDSVGRRVRVHLFGVSRWKAAGAMKDIGIASVDSASALRSAWMGAERNYHLPGGVAYAALRIPQAAKSFRAKRMTADPSKIIALEQSALRAVRDYAAGSGSSSGALSALLEYDALMGHRPGIEAHYRRTLEDRPWEVCRCQICTSCGVEVIIFRGSNRNRRRGFHNTHVFYNDFRAALASSPPPPARVQASLFEAGE